MNQLGRAVRMRPHSWEGGPEANSESAVGTRVCKVPMLPAPVLLTPYSLPLNPEPLSSLAPEQRLRPTSWLPSPCPPALHVLSHTGTLGRLHSHLEVLPSAHLTYPHTLAPGTLGIPRVPHTTSPAH